ncbi:unnamed protein product [Paramecium sonneborni]|uniref:Uncharacterized protein n=1 Tax=Paramecium sonneborni TaxID=65129 RepID=A0A8S1P3H5_9CILI|nr:unnamed protein product [Paramecium sonneborni]
MSNFKYNVEDVIKKLELQIQENRKRTKTLSLVKQSSFNNQSKKRLNTIHNIPDQFLLQQIDVHPLQDITQRKMIVNQRLRIQQRKYYQKLFSGKIKQNNQKTEFQNPLSYINLKQIHQNSLLLPIVLKQRQEIKKLIKPSSNFMLN